MAKQRNRSAKAPAPAATPFEEARDELFQHIMRCGVVGSEPEHQQEWFVETMTYMKDRYPKLAAEQLEELRKLGEKLCDTIPGSRLVRLPGTGRLVPEESPETLAKMILEFVGAAAVVRTE